jgi:hypothetical protein
VLAQLAMTLHDQGVKLADDGVARLRACQAALQERQRLAYLAQLLKHATQVEERERIVGMLGILQVQEPQIALQLAPPQGRVLVADVLDHHLRGG